MLKLIEKVLLSKFANCKFDEPILCHHNYVAEKLHFGKKILVTHKDTIHADTSELGIIPKSIKTHSYVVHGLNNANNFNSASHNTGHRISHNQAKRTFTIQDLIKQT